MGLKARARSARGVPTILARPVRSVCVHAS